MDTTEVNVKMCEKAEEIQKEWAPHWGDWIADVGDYRSGGCVMMTVRFKASGFADARSREELTWLPRQDQLQKIDGRHWREFDAACEYEFGQLTRIEQNTATKEQCGIRVIMRKYGKIWNGEEWVKRRARRF